MKNLRVTTYRADGTPFYVEVQQKDGEELSRDDIALIVALKAKSAGVTVYGPMIVAKAA